MFNIFKSKIRELVAPIDGEIIALEKVDDPVFSTKMMGDGFAVIPSDNQVVSPCNGTVVQVFKTKHAIIVKDEFGLGIIIHVGLDTVKLKGQGFDVKVKDGDTVSRGDILMEVDFKYLKEQGKDIVTPIVITEMEGLAIKTIDTGKHQKGDVVLTFQ